MIDTPLNIKVRWLVASGFAGWMAISLDTDDFHGSICNEGFISRYLLMLTDN